MHHYTQPEFVKQLREDLSRKYQLHGPRIEQLWRSWSASQREEAVRAGAKGGEVLRTPTDKNLGRVRLFMPEWNLQDLAGPHPDVLLFRLRHRATTSLTEQYARGPNGEPGDAETIQRGMREGLRHVKLYPHEFTQFYAEDVYGQSMDAGNANNYRQVLAGMSTAVNAGVIVPRSTGELILQRQLTILQALNILRQICTHKKATQGDKLSIGAILARAEEQKSAAEDYLALCRTEPAFLTPIVNMWFMTRPELLPDEKGQRIPLITDKYKSIAVFEVLHAAVIGVAVWEYLCRLFQGLLDKKDDKKYRSIVLQEISNVCHFAYSTVQNHFKRHVQACSGSKYFTRASAGRNKEPVRVVMKIQYILSLCEPKVDAAKAVHWIKKLDEFHREQPAKMEDLMESESEAFGDLSVTTAFIQSLAASLSLPPPNKTKGQLYLLKLKALTTELDGLKDDLDLSQFVVPIDNLLEPGVARQALLAVNEFIVQKAGAEIGVLYDGLADEAMTAVQDQSAETETIERELEARLSIMETPSPAVIVEQRREKVKTRPAHSSVYSIVPQESPTEPEVAEQSPIYPVKEPTFEVFSTLFSKSESHGSVTWAAFQAAMADLKFSVVPRFGSVFTFLPHANFSPSKAFTIHRPHQSRSEGYKLIYFANRLKRIYGWGEESFVIA
ncbi:hypothetical protein BDW59DRAFT_179403 [Aspergillus cavernicola]|uniref:Uncharacterized protein n=1 Tax=Aspergillus cavernicola TaxID=176166 RepID=A0ABR4IIP0_9EURO